MPDYDLSRVWQGIGSGWPSHRRDMLWGRNGGREKESIGEKWRGRIAG